MNTLLIEQSNRVIRISLNRPDVRNAFNEEVIAELTEWAHEVAWTGARAAVLSGTGTVFCAGADLEWMSRMVGYSAEANIADASKMSEMFNALDTLPIPLIGRIHGAALGGGAGLAAVCDIVVASENAIFGFTEAKLGILPAVIAPFAVRKIGVSAARELFLTAARFSSARARELGLVHAVAPEEGLDAAVDGYVQQLLTSGPEAIAGAKQLIASVADRPPRDVAELTATTIARHRVSKEGQDGMRAFLEKRRAPWVP